MTDVYEMLAETIAQAGGIPITKARDIANELENEGLVDYDCLKEYYLYDGET